MTPGAASSASPGNEPPQLVEVRRYAASNTKPGQDDDEDELGRDGRVEIRDQDPDHEPADHEGDRIRDGRERQAPQ